MKYPTYIKAVNGDIGVYAYLTLGNRPVYKFENGDYKFRAATEEELTAGSDRLSDLQQRESFSMQWKQLSSTKWEEVGRFGKFYIERGSGKFWAFYVSRVYCLGSRQAYGSVQSIEQPYSSACIPKRLVRASGEQAYKFARRINNETKLR